MKKWLSITVILTAIYSLCLNAQPSNIKKLLPDDILLNDTLPLLKVPVSLIPSYKDTSPFNLDRVKATANQAGVSQLKVIDSELKNKLDAHLVPFIKKSNFIISSVKDIIEKPVVLNDLDIQYQSLTDTSYLRNGSQYVFNELSFRSNWTVAQIPVSLNYSQSMLNDGSNNHRSPLSFQYIRDSFQHQLKRKYLKELDVSELLPNMHDPLSGIKKQAEDAFSARIQQLNASAKNILSEEIKALGGMDAIVKQDINELKRQYLNADVLQQFNAHKELYQQLLIKKNIGEWVDVSYMEKLERHISKVDALDKFVKEIESTKRQWEESGLVKQLKEWEVMKSQLASDFLNNPANFSKLAKDKFNLNSLQKLLLKVDKLDIGQNTLSTGKLSLNHFMNNGVVSRFANMSKHSTVILSSINELRSVWDANFTTNLHGNNGSIKGFNFGKGKSIGTFSNFSFMSFDQTVSTLQQALGLRNFKQTMVTSFAKQLEIGASGKLTAEISKSASTYAGQGQQKVKSNIESLLSIDNFLNNTALQLKYIDNLPHIDFNYHLELGGTSLDYSNPGNNFLNAGSREIGAGFRKSFMHKRLQISARTKFRSFNYSNTSSDKWLNTYGVYDARWKLNKNQFITLRYIPNSMVRHFDGDKNKVSIQRRLSVETNLQFRNRVLQYRNYINLSYLQNDFLMSAAFIKNNTLSISSYQNINLKKRHIFITATYNHAEKNTAILYFNSSMMAEAGTTYTLFKKLSGSSSLGYNSVQDWYQQIGIRQTISGNISNKISASLFVDARKNLKKYSDLYISSLRGNISLHYTLKN